MLVPLGENASITDIFNKLDGFYGNACTSETHVQSFDSDFQKDSESIVVYGSRLEQTLFDMVIPNLLQKTLCYAANFGQV